MSILLLSPLAGKIGPLDLLTFKKVQTPKPKARHLFQINYFKRKIQKRSNQNCMALNFSFKVILCPFF